jgi:hypothetical protein
MNINDFLAQPITGVRAFNELAIDDRVWNEAHGQHTRHRQLHGLTFHRPGIVYGLEVVLSGGASGPTSAIVAPGVAIDDEGRTVVLSAPATHTFRERGQFYLTLQYELVLDSNSKVPVSGGEEEYRLVETGRVILEKEAPANGQIELARVYRMGADKPVRAPQNPYNPGPDELNTLHRCDSFPRCYADLWVNELPIVPQNTPNDDRPNRAGLVQMLREASGNGFHVGLLSPANPSSEPTVGGLYPTLIYVAGREAFKPLPEATIAGLRRHLDNGGTLWGDVVGNKPGDGAEFEKAFMALAGQLGAKPTAIDSGHPLLTAHHVFASVPDGARSGEMRADTQAGVLLSTTDYGGAWQGRVANGQGGREQIRQTQEWGRNVLAWADLRKRLRDLERLR